MLTFGIREFYLALYTSLNVTQFSRHSPELSTPSIATNITAQNVKQKKQTYQKSLNIRVISGEKNAQGEQA
jgi:hypothetical protein